MQKVQIGTKYVGCGEPCFITAEIGINHNGDIELAKQLIDITSAFGCDAVKFQKRTIEVVYTPEELAKPRESPFGYTNGDLKRGLEFGQEQYEEIDAYCRSKGILWFASCWEEGSVDFMEQFNPPCYKIASASLTNDDFLRYTAGKGKPIILSTGMSTLEEIDHAVEVLGKDDLIILHCTSTYPAAIEEINVKVIPRLIERYDIPVGYSGHEVGILPSILAATMGACMVERHITMDRAMWGSDQAASLEPNGVRLLVRDIRAVPVCFGDGEKVVYPSEIPVMQKLRWAYTR